MQVAMIALTVVVSMLVQLFLGCMHVSRVLVNNLLSSLISSSLIANTAINRALLRIQAIQAWQRQPDELPATLAQAGDLVQSLGHVLRIVAHRVEGTQRQRLCSQERTAGIVILLSPTGHSGVDVIARMPSPVWQTSRAHCLRIQLICDLPAESFRYSSQKCR